jgi:hypothetical protein
MFGLMTRGEHEAALLMKESELHWARQQNEALLGRIRQGEEYRAWLEAENESVKAANRDRLLEIERLKTKLMDTEGELVRTEHALRGSG